jgi:dienelactone hydrolase
MEKISFTSAYENERMMAYRFLPKNSDPPFQTVIYYPGTNAFNLSSLGERPLDTWFFDFIPKYGRAVAIPMFKGTFDRQEGPCNWELDGESYQFRDCGIKWVQDLTRTIDYLESREDIDTSRVGYYGFSWGGKMEGIVPAIENRLKANVLVTAGLPPYKQLPEIDQIDFVSHVTSPVLMLCGKYDIVFPYELSIAPMFKMLGTAEVDKKLIMYESDHIVPKKEIIWEALAWYDKFLGTIK